MYFIFAKLYQMTQRDSLKRALSKRVALVTGSATRLGKEIAQKLHTSGFDVCIHYHSSSAKAQILADILNSKRTDSAFLIGQDLRDKDAARKIISQFKKHRKRLDLLVNNASIFHKNSLKPTSIKDWDNIITTNTRAPYYLSLSAAPLLKRTNGSIINISDIHGKRPRPDYSIYCVSKAALNAATLSLAIELAPNIRVNSIAPGAIIWAKSEKSAERTKAIGATPLERTGTPKDIAEAVLYFAESNYLTGQILNIDGGRSLNI